MTIDELELGPHECLNHLILFGERQLRHTLPEYVAHFHRERPHEGLDSRLIEPDETANRKKARSVAAGCCVTAESGEAA